MEIEETALPGVMLISYDVFGDERGSFMESYDSKAFASLGLDAIFVQDSCSWSAKTGTVRGFHFQIPPRSQDKLVRVTRGRVFDVIVDVRRDAPTFGQHVSFELDAAKPQAVFVPAGFAHAFCSLSDDTEIAYKMSDHFSPGHYRGLLWSDPALGIAWPVAPADAVVSEKDAGHPALESLTETF